MGRAVMERPDSNGTGDRFPSLVVFWEEINDGKDSLSAIIRDLAIVIGGTIAVLLAGWRIRISERQATAAQDQFETAQKGLLNERYQRGAEMLGSKILSVRLGGIYALGRLAEEHPVWSFVG